MRVKVNLPKGYTYQKAHTSKWALFSEAEGMLGWVRKIRRDIHGTTHAFYAQVMDSPAMLGPFSGKDEAARALIPRS